MQEVEEMAENAMPLRDSQRIKEVFAARLNQCFKKTGMRKIAVARQIGSSGVGVSQFLAGANFSSIEKLVHLADVFDVSIDYLLGRTDDPRVSSISKEAALLLQLPDELLPAYQAAKEKNPENLPQIIETFEKIAEEYHSLSK